MSENNTVQKVFDTLDDSQRKLVYTLVGYTLKTRRMPTILIDYETGNKFGEYPLEIRNLFNTFTDTQKKCVDSIVRDVYRLVNIAFMIGDED